MTARAGHFSGLQFVAPVEAVEQFARAAKAGDEMVYCEAPELIRCGTSTRVRELAAERILRPHNRRREGGGWVFFVVRTGYRPAAPRSAAETALADAATDEIYRRLKRAANLDQPCPSDAELARGAGLESRKQAERRFRKLVDAGLIESMLAFEGGVRTRIVTIVATGKATAPPRKWLEMRKAALREVQGQRSGESPPAAPSYPRARGGAL